MRKSAVPFECKLGATEDRERFSNCCRARDMDTPEIGNGYGALCFRSEFCIRVFLALFPRFYSTDQCRLPEL